MLAAAGWDCCWIHAGTLGTAALSQHLQGALPEAQDGCSQPRLCIWEEAVLKLCLTPRFSAAGQGRGEGGGQSKAAPGRLINSGCEEQGCSALK